MPDTSLVPHFFRRACIVAAAGALAFFAAASADAQSAPGAPAVSISITRQAVAGAPGVTPLVGGVVPATSAAVSLQINRGSTAAHLPSPSPRATLPIPVASPGRIPVAVPPAPPGRIPGGR